MILADGAGTVVLCLFSRNFNQTLVRSNPQPEADRILMALLRLIGSRCAIAATESTARLTLADVYVVGHNNGRLARARAHKITHKRVMRVNIFSNAGTDPHTMRLRPADANRA